MSTLRRRTNSGRETESYTSVVASEDYSVYPKEASKVSYMAYRDRTHEFFSVVKNKENFFRNKDNGYVKSKNRNIKNFHEWANFMEVAKQIGKDISNTYSKLEKLTILAKKRTLFDDTQGVEINQLTYIIKQDLQNLNQQIAHLQELSKSRNNAPGKHMQTHSSSVVLSLQSKLALMSNGFKDVLEVRTENLKHQKNRREQFTSSFPPRENRNIPGPAESMLLQREDLNKSDSSQIAIDMGGNYQHQMQLLDEQDSYMQSRADTMENIEATIVELGSIFTQLAHMVKDQEEMVQRIDSSVEDAFLNVDAAHTQILRYFQNVTSNRYLMIKIFAVLIFFFILFVVFIA